MFSYGLGDAGTGLVATQFGFFLFKFFISAGLPVIIAGSLLMLIKIWDAVNDPLIGWLSDRTKSRWGPRIPWMVAASSPWFLFSCDMVDTHWFSANQDYLLCHNFYNRNDCLYKY